ncbi:hypothetical protein LCGC14_1487170 [marine sediment metagenome]|uniref:Uncharacterized protein n=1 Tax=marine sediment metagenome TaxID=412755 RepID=A0A0F9JTQ1_9ZZZZ
MLVLWSGGCDSTLLLHDLAKNSSEYHPIRTISVIHPQIAAIKEQRAARKKVLRWMKKSGYHIFHQEIEVKHSGENIFCNEHEGAYAGNGISQYPIWMLSAVNYLQAEEDMYLGYIKGDDIWDCRYQIEESFRLLLHIMGKKGEIKFPLDRHSKPYVIQALKERGLYDLTWYCEDPDRKGKRCGVCHPCIKHDVSLYQIELVNKREKAKVKKKKARRKQ